MSEIKEYMDILNKIYPDKEVKYIEINKFGEKESLIREIRYLLAMDKNIEGLKPYFPQDDYNEVSCWNGLENYLNDEKWVMMKEIYLVGGCWIKELKEGLNKIKNYKLWSFDESLNEYFADELIYKDYISLPQKVLWTILWILYFIGWLLPLLAFIFLIRSVTYYVVFGKIFPPK